MIESHAFEGKCFLEHLIIIAFLWCTHMSDSTAYQLYTKQGIFLPHPLKLS